MVLGGGQCLMSEVPLYKDPPRGRKVLVLLIKYHLYRGTSIDNHLYRGSARNRGRVAKTSLENPEINLLFFFKRAVYRGTSLTRNTPLLGPYM